MPRFDSSLARALDFGNTTTTSTPMTGALSGRRAVLRLAPQGRRLSGPDRYKVLERRRRDAQIRARRLLDLLDAPTAEL